MKTKTLMYKCGEVECKGYLAYDETNKEPAPCVIVAHAWKGQDDFARQKAESLAELGYVGFAADIYGNGTHVETNEEAAAHMGLFFLDRKLLRERMAAAYHAAANLDISDAGNMGAIGFCFGGLSVIELLRSGLNLRGVVSFHGLLGHQLGDWEAEVVPNADQLSGSLLILHGNDDPMVPQKDILAIQDEMSDAGVDWQMNIYGNAMHAFTNPLADDAENGMLYNRLAERRAVQSMENFFEEVFV